jgi:hypothetical protein
MKENGDVEFLDLFNPNQPRVDRELVEHRLSICHTCPFFTGKRCLKCGCYMQLKGTLLNAKCPMGHW